QGFDAVTPVPLFLAPRPAGVGVFFLRFAGRGERFFDQVVEAADDPDEHAGEEPPRLRAELPVDPVARQREAGGGACQLEAGAGVTDPAWKALISWQV